MTAVVGTLPDTIFVVNMTVHWSLHNTSVGPNTGGIEGSDGSGDDDDVDGMIILQRASIFYDNTLVAVNYEGAMWL